MKMAFLKLGLTALIVLFMFGESGASKQIGNQRFEIIAKRFSYQPNEITVKKGQPVTLVFHSMDVNHGFASEDFHLKAEIPKHQTTQVTFTPQHDGDFIAKCAHFCGAGHGQMQLTIHVAE